MSLSNKKRALVANTIRGLAMDAVQKANSGHPGMPMGNADFAAVLYLEFLKHLPTKPDWADRDRFVLSAGHGSMLLYALLHLSGYDLSLEELQAFRQWGSRTPGHPEHGLTPGVETSTGPLGQGCGNGAGMALAEAMLAQRFNVKGHDIVNHYTYVLASDGDMMEGVSHEVFALAGHLGLNKLIVWYDSNRITIEGSTDLAYSDDVKKRFQAYNWNVLEVDGHDYDEIEDALNDARKEKKRPTIIIGQTHIGHGSPNLADTSKVHGEPMGPENVTLAKKKLKIPDEDFHVPAEVRELFAKRQKELEGEHAQWKKRMQKYEKAMPALAEQLQSFYGNQLPADLESKIPAFSTEKPEATRASSGTVIQSLAKELPNLVGGSADLAPSTKTLIKDGGDVGPHSFEGRNFHFGVREHGMGAILNGMALHGGFRVFGATFFVFADYLRPAARLAALMKLPVIYVFTHDSFYVGEDGPTHEPIEQATSLRIIPNMTVIRPADATETAAAWVAALKNNTGPTAILLTRQGLPVIDRSTHAPADRLENGAYTLWQSGEGNPGLILIASGSEVSLILEAAKLLATPQLIVRVVSMPSWELFDKQPKSIKDQVLPASCKKRLAIEAGSPVGWEKYVGDNGRVFGLDRFGASGPYKVLAEKFGFVPANVVKIARELLAEK